MTSWHTDKQSPDRAVRPVLDSVDAHFSRRSLVAKARTSIGRPPRSTRSAVLLRNKSGNWLVHCVASKKRHVFAVGKYGSVWTVIDACGLTKRVLSIFNCWPAQHMGDERINWRVFRARLAWRKRTLASNQSGTRGVYAAMLSE